MESREGLGFSNHVYCTVTMTAVSRFISKDYLVKTI